MRVNDEGEEHQVFFQPVTFDKLTKTEALRPEVLAQVYKPTLRLGPNGYCSQESSKVVPARREFCCKAVEDRTARKECVRRKVKKCKLDRRMGKSSGPCTPREKRDSANGRCLGPRKETSRDKV